MNVRRNAEDLIAQAGIDREGIRDFEVVLKECGNVDVALILSEEAGAAAAESHIAEPLRTAILHRALPKQEIVECVDIEELVGREGSLKHHLQALRFRSHPHCMVTSRKRNRILPDEVIGDLPLRGRSGIACNKEPIDVDCCCWNLAFREACRRLRPNV